LALGIRLDSLRQKAVISIGTVLHDTYRIDEELGRGGMGMVFAATHLRLPRRVAIKVLLQTTDEQTLKRFRREAEICSRIGHRHIVEVLDFNLLPDGQPYIVMELLQGESLRQRLERVGALPRPLMVQLAREVGKGLAAAHKEGVVHRDLKPENLFISLEYGEERFKILDFGISKIMGAVTLLTNEEMMLGTPAYMSPEQARGEMASVGARADQFSLATIFYEALTGQPAFHTQGDTPYSILYKIVHRDPAPLFDQPPAVQAVIARAMAKEPEARFADVGELAEAFVNALEGREVAAAAPAASQSSTQLQALAAPSRRLSWLLWIAVAVMALGVGFGLLALRGRRAPEVVTPVPSQAPKPAPSPAPPVTNAPPVATPPAPTPPAAHAQSTLAPPPATPPTQPAKVKPVKPKPKPTKPKPASDDLADPYHSEPPQ
jgi:serine/threonine-protein kinase